MGIKLHLPGGGLSTYAKSFCKEVCLSFPIYVFPESCIYISVNWLYTWTKCILWVMVQSYIVCLVARITPGLATAGSLRLVAVSLDRSPPLTLEDLLSFCNYKMCQACSVFSPPHPQNPRHGAGCWAQPCFAGKCFPAALWKKWSMRIEHKVYWWKECVTFSTDNNKIYTALYRKLRTASRLTEHFHWLAECSHPQPTYLHDWRESGFPTWTWVDILVCIPE